LPDATGLELIAADVRERFGDQAVVDTLYYREHATLEVLPPTVHEVLRYLKQDAGDTFPHLMSVHGCDYLPEEPRLGVHYELMSRERVERLNVKTRVGVDNPSVPSVTDLFPTADFQEREVYDMFGVEFDGHPDHRRILMPEDYEGFPQRRDFPIGGETVIFTYNEDLMPRWYD
jgi:NADH-quinone oxidoreductase subunit C